jgi:predicted  nucleic acid-binding Zn-ribbon protein
MLSQKIVRPVAVVLVSSMLAACAATPDGRLAQAQGTGIGMVVGAVAGGALGYAVGGRQGLVTGAAIGGGTGAAMGFAYGTHVAHLKAKYASREAWLDACIVQAHQVNANAYNYSRSLESRIARLEARSRAARVAHNKSEARSIKQEVAALKVEAKSKTGVVQKEISDQQTAVSEGRGARNYNGLKSEVNSLQETKGTLGRQINRLAGLENQLDV